MKKKFLALTLTAAMVAGILSGCTENMETNTAIDSSETDNTTTEVSSESTTTTKYNGGDNLKISEDSKEITLFYAFGANGAPTGDSKVWKKILEITNLSMKNVANESISDAAQSLNTMLASNELPDLIQGQMYLVTPLIAQGVYQPLDDLIDQYAPNIQKFLKDYPEAVNVGKGTDGQMYLISGTLGGEPGQTLPSMGFFMRKDWMEKLNLEVPTTLEEYKNVLYAFRNEDPNGNGKQDEIPYFSRESSIRTLLQLWGAHEVFYVASDGKVHFGKSETEYRNALTDLSQWYADGIIDPEIFTRGSNARQDLLGNDIGGATIDWFASTGAVNDALREMVPNINFAAIAPPKDVNGTVKMDYGRNALHDYAWGISSTCEDPVIAIKLMDFCFSDTGSRLLASGIEGEDYTLADEKVVPTETALSNDGGYPTYLRSIGASFEIGYYANLEGEKASMNTQAREGFELYEQSDWIQKQFPKLAFTKEEQKVIDDNMTNINSLVTEYEQSCMLGNQSVADTWEQHISNLNGMNLQEVLDAYNSAYARYNATN